MKDYTVPLTLISILADAEFHSGEQLGERLGMSRAAINKHIQTLRDWGVDVFTVPGKGYSLPEPIQLLDEEQIARQIEHGRVTVLPVIDSTNQYLLDRLSELQSGDACVAEYQQAGRGRRGRKWFSPFGSNLYLSMYWRLEQGPAAAIGLSLVIGIVIAEVLQSLGADKVRVKWPNDLYLQDRKLSGILVELTGKTGDAAQIVSGAGINLGGLDRRFFSVWNAEFTIQYTGSSHTSEVMTKIVLIAILPGWIFLRLRGRGAAWCACSRTCAALIARPPS